jgi:hypothetical protein
VPVCLNTTLDNYKGQRFVGFLFPVSPDAVQLVLKLRALHCDNTKSWSGHLDYDAKCGYEVPGVILVQVCLCTYSLLRGSTFDVLLLRSYILSLPMLLILETLKGRKTDHGENCIMMNFTACILHRILLG